MQLPYPASVSKDQIVRKLLTYSLNFEHPAGKHKAILFRAKLGITSERYEILLEALLEQVTYGNAEYTKTSQYGHHYLIDFPVTTNVGTSIIRSAWLSKNTIQRTTWSSVYPIRTKGEIL